VVLSPSTIPFRSCSKAAWKVDPSATRVRARSVFASSLRPIVT
jgi:hypothetical protein